MEFFEMLVIIANFDIASFIKCLLNMKVSHEKCRICNKYDTFPQNNSLTVVQGERSFHLINKSTRNFNGLATAQNLSSKSKY